MKILVTGATGYLGGHICEFLQNKGYNVTGFIRNPKKTQLLDSLAIPYKIGDVTDQLSLELVMEEGYDAIINSAGYASDRGPWETFRSINVEGTRNLAEAMKNTGISRLIHVSSVASYGDTGLGTTEDQPPKNPRWFKYGVTKRASEEVLHEYSDLQTTYLRPGHVVGRRDRFGFVPILYHSMRKNPQFINHGNSITSLVYIDDVCHAVDLILQQPDTSVNEAYNLVTPEQVSIKEIVAILNQEMGIPMPTKSLGFRRAFYTATMFEWLSAIFKFKLPVSRMAIVLAGRDFHASTEKITQHLGWHSSKTIEEMLKEWADWRKEFEAQRKKS
jgi:nucleoside-diphosphate-sugar epimerase